MIADYICNLFHAFSRADQQVFCLFQAYFLYVCGIAHSGLVLDKAVEVIFLEMKGVHQLLDCNVGRILPNILSNFFEEDPVHGLALLQRQREFVCGAEQTEDAKQQSLADITGTDGVAGQFF